MNLKNTYQLVILEGPQPGRGLPLLKSELIIGRDIACDLVIPESIVSRRHVRIYQKDDQFLVEDLGSANGTFINGKRLLGAHILQTNDELKIADAALLRFEPIPESLLTQIPSGSTSDVKSELQKTELIEMTLVPPANQVSEKAADTPGDEVHRQRSAMKFIANPYVGARSFETGEKIYGRDRQIRQVFELLVAGRVMLLHSPSGAGKSSLVKAGLIPRLKNSGYHVLPVIRVNQERPQELIKSEDTAIFLSKFNRYVFSTLLSLDEALPEEQHTPLQHLAMSRLSSYLDARRRATDEPEKKVLIFDQFEEILTTAPSDLEGKHVFFTQLGEALQNTQIWALFLIREDYLGALDPFLRPIPTRMANTYRLDMLNVENARQAVQKPAAKEGVTFTDSAAQKLIDDLRMMQVQQLDGSMVDELGPYVEPVQLQVVCFRLWENLPAGDEVIDETDLAVVGSVNQSLADYYASIVSKAVTYSGVNERKIREWFNEQLIVGGIRNQVLKSTDASGGLDNRAVQALLDAHLVRAEQRAGATWFELAHDRLIEPVQENNKSWFEKNLSLLQRQAALWDQSGRPDGLLLQGNSFTLAENWASDQLSISSKELASQLKGQVNTEALASRNQSLTKEEFDFLQSCYVARERSQRERMRNRVIAGLGIGAAVMAVIALFFMFRSNSQANENARLFISAATGEARNAELFVQASTAEAQAQSGAATAEAAFLLAEAQKATAEASAIEAQRQTRLALNSQLVAQSQASKLTFPQRSLLLALEAGQMAQAEGGTTLTRSMQAMFDNLQTSSGRGLIGHEDFVNYGTFSPDNRWLATASKDGTVILWDTQNLGAAPSVLEGHTEWVNELAFSPDGRYLATVSDDKTARLWDMQNPGQSVLLEGHEDWISAVVFTPDGKYLATGSGDSTIRVWDVNNPGAEPAVLTGHEGLIWDMDVSPDGVYLASAGQDQTVRLYNIARSVSYPSSDAIVLQGADAFIEDIAFSPSGKWLAVGDDNGEARAWDMMDLNAPPIKLDGHDGWISAIAFSPDEKFLATAGNDRMARVWELSRPNEAPFVLKDHLDTITSLAYTPDGNWLITGSDDQTVRAWNTSNFGAKPLVLRGHEGAINHVAVSPDGRWLSSNSDDTTSRLWDLGTGFEQGFIDLGSTPIVITAHQGAVWDIAFNPDGRWFASGDNRGLLFMWDLQNPSAPPIFLPDHSSYVNTLAFSPDGKWLASPDTDYNVRLWRVEDLIADPLSAPILLQGHQSWISTLAFSGDVLDRPDNQWLAAASTDGSTLVWNLEELDADPLYLGGHEALVYSLAFNPDSTLLATASDDFTSRLWDLQAMVDDPNTQPAILTGHEGTLWAAAFSPDGLWLATASDDGTARIWDVENPEAEPIVLVGSEGGMASLAFSPSGKWLATGTGGGYKSSSQDYTVWLWAFDDLILDPELEPLLLRGHKGPIWDLAFSPDERWLASTGKDATTRLWDLDNLDSEPIILSGHDDEIWNVAFSQDGRWLATGSDDQTAMLWLLDPIEQKILACRIAARNLTDEEWNQFFPGEAYQETCNKLP